ncbi:PriCT-2 domain-containing protein [Paracoccus alcaliphilus]|nr:PriCT-2 domain-containing protein [Paracoccus alcaliphilus]
MPNDELDYDSWMRIGMALKGALGEAGAGVFTDWSAQVAKDVAATTAKAWASFKPDRIGAGTIYHLAMERGWQPDAALHLDGSLDLSGSHPAADLLARLDGTAPAISSPGTPAFSLIIPDGLVGDLTGYMLTTARRPQPLLSLGASLCAIGALMGRHYRTTTNLRSNLYVVGIADSGSGKNHAREIINEVFFEAGLAHHLGGNKIASGAGLLTALHRQPAILFQIDEFGMFLSAAADRKRRCRLVLLARLASPGNAGSLLGKGGRLRPSADHLGEGPRRPDPVALSLEARTLLHGLAPSQPPAESGGGNATLDMGAVRASAG